MSGIDEQLAYEKYINDREAVRKTLGELGVVFGWAIVCTKNGKPVEDNAGAHIPDDVMMEGAMGFMESRRALKAMHGGKTVGTVVFAWPMTAEVAEAMGIATEQTGLMVGVKPTSSMLGRFKSGEFPAFSIGAEAEFDEGDE